MSDEFRPDNKSRWAGGNANFRHYHLWHSRPPWGNWDTFYKVERVTRNTTGASAWMWDVGIRCNTNPVQRKFGFSNKDVENLGNVFSNLKVDDAQQVRADHHGLEVVVEYEDSALDDAFAATLASTLIRFIKAVTPVIDEFEDDRNAEDA